MPYEILSPEQMYRADGLSIAAGIKSLNLMERAGAAVAEEVAQRWKTGIVVILCGPGNNGGDGFVAARLLKRRRRQVRVFLLGEQKSLKGDAAANAKRWDGAIESIDALAKCLSARQKPAVIVDALFGAGLSRNFPQALAEQINRAGVPILSVDVPSGLDGLTGFARGASVKADVTVTFFRKKPAHVLLPGKELCGEVLLADIGIPASVLNEIAPVLVENSVPTWPALTGTIHKYQRGHALIVSGPRFLTGASRLAAMAAQRAGAGLVTIAGEAPALLVHAAHVSSIMLREAGNAAEIEHVLADRRINAVCVGPALGLGVGTQAKVNSILGGAASVVLDADALTSFAQDPQQLFDRIRQRSAATVLTPHEGEFRRLFKSLSVKSESKIELVQRAAEATGAIVLLKGGDTVIAAPDGRAKVNTNAPPSLAMAGSGDVLAGLITGLLAQGMDTFDAACAGAWLHGNSAAHLPARGLIAEDLIQNLRFDE